MRSSLLWFVEIFQLSLEVQSKSTKKLWKIMSIAEVDAANQVRSKRPSGKPINIPSRMKDTQIISILCWFRLKFQATKVSFPSEKEIKFSLPSLYWFLYFLAIRLPSWQPILTAGTVLPTFFIIGIAFIPVGIVLLYFSNTVSHFLNIFSNSMN